MQSLFLADFTVIRPEPGLIFWTTVIFAIFWFLMSKLAFKPIAKALKERENDIQGSLDEAKKAREEMANLKSENEALLAQAQEERSNILKEAKAAKESIINEAKNKAKEEAKKIVTNAKAEIENQKKAAIIDLKNQIGNFALEIAEKVIDRELKSQSEHEQYVNDLVKDLDLN
ncbi:MAG: F0F1 ATP synthase subunit B [Bacteroidetes bacterium]|nr:F0F1 ATP synthase subunit B [Bacteroidota bacterium]